MGGGGWSGFNALIRQPGWALCADLGWEEGGREMEGRGGVIEEQEEREREREGWGLGGRRTDGRKCVWERDRDSKGFHTSLWEETKSVSKPQAPDFRTHPTSRLCHLALCDLSVELCACFWFLSASVKLTGLWLQHVSGGTASAELRLCAACVVGWVVGTCAFTAADSTVWFGWPTARQTHRDTDRLPERRKRCALDFL